MPTPSWQVWTDFFLKGLGPLMTFLAVLVALFGARLRHWIRPPQLVIALANADGWKGWLYNLDSTTNRALRSTEGIWYHVRVENGARWDPVTGVHIFALSIEAPDASGDFKAIESSNAPLGWRHEPSIEPKRVGYPAECDLCHIIKSPLQVRLSPLNKGQIPDLFTQAFKIAVTLQARGIEGDSNRLRVEISWDGGWSDDREEMKRHFVVKPITT
jgi:hypothetical protein